ncbi:MAG TPA: DUF3489 domain-containing protein [Nitrospira sp.]|nr:DUF3489 domain-containing protein [Nitrospira sp.]
MNAKLTATQTTVIKAAANRLDGNIEPLQPSLRGGARAKVIEGLLAKGLVAGADGHHLLTDAGYAAVGKRRPVPKGLQQMDALAKHETTNSRKTLKGTQNVGTPAALQNMEGTPRTIRPGTKLATIIDAMRHPDGATITQMMAGTGWQAHTVRGAISGMVRKKLGYEVVAEKSADGQRTYRIA